MDAVKTEAGIFDELREALGGESGSEGPVHWANLPAGARFRVGRQWIQAVDPIAASPR